MSEKMMVERRAAEATVLPEEQKQAILAGKVKALARQASLTETDAVAAAVSFASARPEEFGEFIRGGPAAAGGGFRRRLRFLSEPWFLQVTLVLYLFAVMLAFMIGMLYSPAITMAVAVATLAIMFLWPGWGVTLSIAVIAAALISIM